MQVSDEFEVLADCFGANPVASALGNPARRDPGEVMRTYHQGQRPTPKTGTFYLAGNRNFLFWSDKHESLRIKNKGSHATDIIFGSGVGLVTRFAPATFAAETMKSQFTRMPTGVDIEVRLKSKHKLRGARGEASDSGFTLVKPGTGDLPRLPAAYFRALFPAEWRAVPS